MMAVVGHFPLMGCQRQTNLTPATVYIYIYIYTLLQSSVS